MRAHLACHARRLVHHARAPSCCFYAARTSHLLLARPLLRNPCRRTFFNHLFRKPPREVKQPVHEPGWTAIKLWRSYMLSDLRAPQPNVLIAAWRELMGFKLSERIPLNSTQALECRRLLEYLADPPGFKQQAQILYIDDLRLLRHVLLDIEPQEKSSHHLDLARALDAMWRSGNYVGVPPSPELQWNYLIKSLCYFGASTEALPMLYSKWHEPGYNDFLNKHDLLVCIVAEGLSQEGRESELLELVDFAEKNGILYDANLQSVMVRFFAKQDRILETKHWFEKQIPQDWSQTGTYRTIAFLAWRNDLVEWAKTVFLKLGQSEPWKKYWMVMMQAMLLFGKSVEDVSTMMSHMISHGELVYPDTFFLNNLLDVAVELQDGSLGQQLVLLGEKKGFIPNAETHLILLRLCLATNNLTTASQVFAKVRNSEPWRIESKPTLLDDYRHLVNQFLLQLCEQTPLDLELVLSLLEAAERDQVRLMANTVATLCQVLLTNDQRFEILDVLAVHAFTLSEDQRRMVLDVFVQYCLDPRTSTARAWDAYQILRQLFRDTNLETREKLMMSFFDRKRPDMATEVLVHMRQLRNLAMQPTIDTYARCFEGFARYQDADGLAQVHNMLKVDARMQPTTKLQTALMLAYAAHGMTRTAMDYWHDISQSREGPSYASLEAVFWTLEKLPQGAVEARQIWEKVVKMDLEVPHGVYMAYIGAIASGGNEMEVQDLITKMTSITGAEVDPLTDEFEVWVQARYPEPWIKAKAGGVRVDKTLRVQLKMQRVMRA